MAWAWLTPTLTHVIMCDPVTSGAKDEQCHLGCLFEGKLECLMHAIDEVSPSQRLVLNATAPANIHIDTLMDDQHDPASHPSPIDINALDDKLDDLQILLLQLNQKPQCHGI
ncbi:hypothetical protein BJV77DRAFT_964655 [Russula vinacea]|nr:hypothetical protein BJV77DRAFT_964655 [Russula vinacea]